MVSFPGVPPGPRRPVRPAARAVVAAVAVLLVLAIAAAPAGAQPVPIAPVDPSAPGSPGAPGDPADPVARLKQVELEAEALTEQWHAARDDLEARQGEVRTLRDAVEPVRVAAYQARTDEERYRRDVDVVVASTFESGNLDQFNALLASGSPQDFLDQMSALEALSADHRDALEQLLAVVDETARAQADADAATARAQYAVDEAARAEQDLVARKRDAEIRIDEAERLVARLTPEQRQVRGGPAVDAPSTPVTGSGAGVRALQAAKTQFGKPYGWGAEGPGRFDCSGLTSWAFQQAGVTLPRSSSQQARVGKPVSWNDLEPGDLVFYYSPVSHVGIYAGDGKMVDSQQTGSVVGYRNVSSKSFTAARRL